jgi:ribosome recycling factor
VEDKMAKTVSSTAAALALIRTDGIAIGLLDRVRVDIDGKTALLSQVAKISSPQLDRLRVEPLVATHLKAIEVAVSRHDRSLSVTMRDNAVVVIAPSITSVRRTELIKKASLLCEEGKVSLRNIRRDGVEVIKRAETEKIISKDSSQNHQVFKEGLSLN